MQPLSYCTLLALYLSSIELFASQYGYFEFGMIFLEFDPQAHALLVQGVGELLVLLGGEVESE